MEVFGNVHGLSPSDRRELERLYRRRVPFDVLTTTELTRTLASVSHATHRQVAVLIDRAGEVTHVVVGDATKVMLPDLGRVRAGQGRFRGLRLVHTHLRSEPLSRDDLVDLTRLRLDMIAAICIAPDGHALTVHYAHCVPVLSGSDIDPFLVYPPTPYAKLDCNPQQLVTAVEEEFARAARTRDVQAKDGRAILVHVRSKRNKLDTEASLAELKELARTAGVDVADSVIQVRDQVDPKYVLGRGRLESTVLRAMQLDVETLIFDHNLTAAQSNAIAALTDLKVIDRTQLILDIFAQRAESADGRLQVELAQMRYLLPRLGQKDDALSRLTGGIGGRGPGETKLEIGRRRAKERVTQLENRLRTLGKQRVQRRARRDRRGVPVVAIVGYTNAGKSTLLNTLTDSHVIVEDKLFATLDTRSRRLRFPREREIVITDTVGFIRELPDELFTAFRATFEEAGESDLLLHVIDAADPQLDSRIETTHALLEQLGLLALPRLVVLNKADLLPAGQAEQIAKRFDGVAVSAMDRNTLHPLLVAIESSLFPQG
jgi:GTP-binding protein HflX